MDWPNERYVRVYTRDTDDWLALSWEAHATWLLLLRKVDRAGVLATKAAALGIARLTGLPREVVDVALPQLLGDGCLTEHALGYVVPNFIEAQEASQTDRQRAHESRARRRELQRAQEAIHPPGRMNPPAGVGIDSAKSFSGPKSENDTCRDADVTNRDSTVTTRDQNVTSGHTLSQAVTTCHSSLSLTDPDQTRKNPLSPPPFAVTKRDAPDQAPCETPSRLSRSRSKARPKGATDEDRAVARRVLTFFTVKNGVQYQAGDHHTKLIKARLREGLTEHDLRCVVGYAWSEKGLGWKSALDSEGLPMARYLTPETLFGSQKIHKYLEPARRWYAEFYAPDQRRKAGPPPSRNGVNGKHSLPVESPLASLLTPLEPRKS